MASVVSTAPPTLAAGPRARPLLDVSAFRRPGLALACYAIVASAVVGAAAYAGPVAGLAGLGVAMGGLAVLRWPAVGAFALVGLVPATAGLKRGLPVPGLRISEVLIVGISTLILVTADRRAAPRWRTFDWVALTYCVATAALGGADLLGRGGALTSDNLGTLFGPFQYLLLYRAVLTGLHTAEQRRRALALLLIVSVPVSLSAVMQAAGVPGVRDVLSSVTDATPQGVFDYYLQQGVGRATGPFAHPHMLGGFELAIVLLAVGMWLDSRARVLSRGALLIVTLAAVGGLLSASTATPVIAAGVGAVVLAWRAGRLRHAVIWLAAVLAVGAIVLGPQISQRYSQEYTRAPGASVSPYIPGSLQYRAGVWERQYLPALSGRWLTGYGPDLPQQITWKFTESLYITLLLRGGVPLLLAFLGLMGALFVAARRVAARDPAPDRVVAARAVAVLVVLLIPMHLVEPYFIDTGLPHVLWALAGLMLAPDLRARRDEATETIEAVPAHAG
ncbi:MAG TPA: hypothetical protein VGN78_13110 [Solirubrobacteraceae bacterium]|jgi:hypothetical protein|nr:hypothetical protein [Solirubrobacteraceae bacterium]